MTEPSRNSTIECTIDCGWIDDVDRARRGTPNSQRASITSRPLFISVAESIVILRPIRHVGCRSASSGVTRASAAAVQPRNGPAGRGEDQPAHLAAVAAVQALVNGVVLAVDRQNRDAAPRARRPPSARPAMTSTSLLASASVLPRVDRRQRGLEAGGARRGAQHDVGVGMASPPPPGRRGPAEQTSRRRAPVEPRASTRRAPPRSPRADDRGPVPRDLLGQQRRVLAGGERHDPQPIRMRVHDRQRALADRSGRSENRDALHAESTVRNEIEDTGAANR